MRPSRLVALALAALALPAPALQAQVVSQTVSLTGEFGSAFYIGEFNSLDRSGTFNPSAGFDIGGGVKYQIATNFALLGTIGFTRLSYVVDDFVRAKYGSNFFGPLTNTTYPGTTVPLTKLNYIDYTRFILFGQSHFNVSSQLVPYFTLGLGLINFSVSNGVGDALPTNITGEYSSQSLVMPIGAGLQYSLDDRLTIHGQGLFYVNSSDYLDGYAHFVDFETSPGSTGPGAIATPPDYPVTFTVGASYAIYLPEQTYQPPIAQAEPPQPQPESQPSQSQPEPEVESVERPPVDSVPMAAYDSDADGLSDSSETERFMTNPSNPDSDDDGLKDYDEVYRYSTSPNHADTDRDGLTDGNEVLVHNTDPLDADSDNDRLVDGDEVNGTRTDAMYTSALNSEVMAVRQATDPLDPDTDGDGVPDGLDACPTLAGETTLKGCPAITESIPDIEAIGNGYRADFEGITFRPNTDDFDFSRPQTQRDLSRLLSLVNQCDDIGLLIEGHTSSEGSQSWNQRLSTKRARRVYQWLIANGVPERKLFGSVGYGSRLPNVPEVGASSELEELRSRNRRITALVRKPC
jgi:outer membrane protein OmpA-like peptidoglycan-associated protein/opacity protein-like surface antigen